MSKYEKINFYTVNILGFVGLLVFLLLFVIFPDISLAECIIYRYTGWYCPACGGTRAVLSLMEGRIGQSLYYHPIVVYAIIAYMAIFLQGWKHWIQKTPYRHPKMTIWWIRIGILLLLGNCIIRNVCLVFTPW